MRHERGQALLLVALALTVLIGIAALVVDLGLSWMLHRDEQNAADPAAIAAAQYIPTGATGSMASIACFYARQNGFFPSATTSDTSSTGCVPANDPRGASMTVNFPPQGPLAAEFSGRPGFVQVIISAQHDSFFGRIFGQTSATVATGAVAAFNTGNSNSNALVALDPVSCHSGQIQGNGGPTTGEKVQLVPVTNPGTGQPYAGGYVVVDSSCGGPVSPEAVAPCGSGDGALKVGGSSSLTAPKAFTYGDCGKDGGATITTNDGSNMVDQGAIPTGDPLAELHGPPLDPAQTTGAACGAGSANTTRDAPNNNGCGQGGIGWGGAKCPDDNTVTCVVLYPGVYYGGWHLNTNKYRLMMNPGLYIIAGGGISQNGSAIEAVSGDGTPADAQVMIYSTDNPNPTSLATCRATWTASNTCEGAINFTAGSSFRANGLGDYACNLYPSTCPYKGMLLWQDGRASCPTLSCPVSLGGGSAALQMSGTVYAPTQLVTINGSGAVSGDTASIQIIAWQWKIVGNSSLLIPYDPTKLYHLDNKGLVH